MAEQIAESIADQIPQASIPTIVFSLFWGMLKFQMVEGQPVTINVIAQ